VHVPRLRLERERAALTQEALADRAGLTRTTITRLERGGSAHLSTIYRLAKALRVRPDRLMDLRSRD
jgi:transcriptional regulator with XRE-family HTH domain